MKRFATDRMLSLLIPAAAYGIIWIDLFLPQPLIALFSSPWFAFSAAKSLLRILFTAFLLRSWLGVKVGALMPGKGHVPDTSIGAAGQGSGLKNLLPHAKDLAEGLLIAAAAGSFALGLAAFSLLSKTRNSLFFPPRGEPILPLTLFLMALVSLGVGYSEELFFRFFMPKALEKALFPASAAVLASALLFGLSHASQGLLGIAGATLLALLFSFFAKKGKSLHALALGHALYDFVILLALI